MIGSVRLREFGQVEGVGEAENTLCDKADAVRSGQECRRSVSGACRESAVDRVQARRAHRSALDQLNKVVGRCKMKRFVSQGSVELGGKEERRLH